MCANVLTAFYQYNRASDVTPTLQYTFNVLCSREYLDGTRYYVGPESFLHFVGRFLRISASPDVRKSWIPVLRQRVEERLGQSAGGNPLLLAMRILLCKQLGVSAELEYENRMLLEMQDESGGWSNGWLYRFGKSGIEVQNAGFTTAVIMQALRCCE